MFLSLFERYWAEALRWEPSAECLPSQTPMLQHGTVVPSPEIMQGSTSAKADVQPKAQSERLQPVVLPPPSNRFFSWLQ
jgi:hypothetical protein